MANILRGSEVAAAYAQRLTVDVMGLKEHGIIPTLGILRVGERPDDIAYARSAVKRCQAVGVTAEQYLFPEKVSQQTLLAAIDSINQNDAVHGLLLLRPLPDGIDDSTVRRALLPIKDVDGITDGSLLGVFTDTDIGFPPCTAKACMEILAHYGINCAGKRAVVVGRSLVVGKPVAMMLLQQNATVTICHSRTEDLPAITKEADILIVAAGKAGFIGKEHVSPGQVVLDVGIHVSGDGSMSGDVQFDQVAPIVSAITPVPGGVGAVTTSVLLSHVIQAAKRS